VIVILESEKIKMDYGSVFLNEAIRVVSEIRDLEKEAISKVSSLLSASIFEGKIAHIFGTGHSAMACKEMFTRAGTLSCFRIVGSRYDLEKFERLEGIAALVLEDYEIKPGELFFIISSSGRNPIPIEIALTAKAKGAVIVAVTSMEHSLAVPSRHSSGKKLYEIADIVIDTHTTAGDAAVQIPGLPMKVGPLSSIANVAIMDAIVVETAARITEAGALPPVRISRNMPGGDENNQKFKSIYGARIPEIKL
jgi:uncharacterized phosphosugar-binding protein